MSPFDSETQRRQLEQAIAIQETLRGTIDDAIIDATIAALQKQLAEFSPAAAVEQQRKVVTVLFMDVVSSTHLMRELDPEENLSIMDTSLQRMAAPVPAIKLPDDGHLFSIGCPNRKISSFLTVNGQGMSP